jgi:putative hemolysin
LLDGLVLIQLVSSIRKDVKVLTNAFLAGISELRANIIPVQVFSAEKACTANLRAVRTAMNALQSGEAIAIFPSGEVSHWRKEARRVTDPPWNPLAVRCAKTTGAQIVPVYFAGENSLTFQVAGLVHPWLRTMRLPAELLNKRNWTVDVRVGNSINPEELAKFDSDERATQYVRARTYVLAHRGERKQPLFPPPLPFPKLSRVCPVAEARAEISALIDELQARGTRVIETEAFAVYAERGERMPALLEELGRLRELTFRAVGEGTGKARDVDTFDSYYTHLILWHKKRKAIAGSYRLAWTEDVLREKGIDGLYTSTLFRCAPEFFANIGPAVELGRSFIQAEFQRDFSPLLLLWQAIGRCVRTRPEAPILFGAVSISANYSEAAREMIVQFLRHRSFRHDLAGLVHPRHPFRSNLLRCDELHAIAECLSQVEDLPLADIESERRRSGAAPAVPQAGRAADRVQRGPELFRCSGRLDSD